MPLTTDEYDALADAVVLLLGLGDDAQVRDQAKSCAWLMANFVRSYTRGNGFIGDTVAEDLQGVIITATARLLTNPAQSSSESESSPLLRFYAGEGAMPAGGKDGGSDIAVQSFAFSGGFSGWSDIEKAILHRYRRRNG